jgi:hypothetical protein
MESFAQLAIDLAPYENKWALSAAAIAGSGLPQLNGAVQFVGIEPAKGLSQSIRAPVVAAVGINYDQGANAASHLRWLRDVKGMPDGVTDCYWKPGVGSAMRDALDHALAARRRNAAAWTCTLRGHPHASTVLPALNDYILVATNLSPFITDRQWTDLKPGEQRAIRGAWPHTDHLDDLANLLHGRVDLWVGHGSDHVWRDFRIWAGRRGIADWQLCYNLSAQGVANMKRASALPGHPRHSLFV